MGYVLPFGVSIGASSVTLTELDTYAIPEAMDPDFAEGFGDLSVHEVATDLTDPILPTCPTTPVGYAPSRSSMVSWSKSAASSTLSAA